MLATRIPMARDGFDAWLAAPLPGLDAIANPQAMYAGWDADGTVPDWDLAGIADSPAAVAAVRAARESTPLELLAARAAGGFTLARHHEDALEIYLYDYHGESYTTHTELLMLAGAGRFARPGTESPVMFWGGDVYPGLPLRDDPPLVVMVVGSGGRARFAETYPVRELTEGLRTVEEAFLAAVVEDDPESYGWDPSRVLDPAIRALVPAPGSSAG
ncbi:hypothetical protein OG216_41625 [Streptomycetaceae bacterium NBC_01309]